MEQIGACSPDAAMNASMACAAGELANISVRLTMAER
jgi:hypothetical protein